MPGLERVDRLLCFLASRRVWCSLDDCARVLKVRPEAAGKIIRILASMGFLDYDEEKGHVRICHDLAELILGLVGPEN